MGERERPAVHDNVLIRNSSFPFSVETGARKRVAGTAGVSVTVKHRIFEAAGSFYFLPATQRPIEPREFAVRVAISETRYARDFFSFFFFSFSGSLVESITVGRRDGKETRWFVRVNCRRASASFVRSFVRSYVRTYVRLLLCNIS